jgi:ABC-type dipeptide/oligopeptide/nickel transport system permease component
MKNNIILWEAFLLMLSSLLGAFFGIYFGLNFNKPWDSISTYMLIVTICAFIFRAFLEYWIDHGLEK